MKTTAVTADRALGFLAARQHLDRPLPAARLADAVGPAGLQDSPPGGAGLSLLARTRGLTPERFERALWRTKTLALVWSARGARYVIRSADFAVFTLGAAPAGEMATRAFVGNVSARAAVASGLTGEAAVARVAEALAKALRGRALSRHHLGGAVKRLLPKPLAPWCRGCEAFHVPVSLLRAGAIRAGVVHAGPGDGDEMSFRLAAEWFPRPPRAMPHAAARRELLVRYLAAYGPATLGRFAKWLGVGPGHARDVWAAVAHELVEAPVAGRPGWVLRKDVPFLNAARRPAGVRMLPAFDSWLAGERDLIVPERARQRDVWRVIDWPGVLVVDGRVAGTWKTRKSGATLTITLRAFRPLAPAVRREAEAQSRAMGPWRGATEVTLAVG